MKSLWEKTPQITAMMTVSAHKYLGEVDAPHDEKDTVIGGEVRIKSELIMICFPFRRAGIVIQSIEQYEYDAAHRRNPQSVDQMAQEREIERNLNAKVFADIVNWLMHLLPV